MPDSNLWSFRVCAATLFLLLLLGSGCARGTKLIVASNYAVSTERLHQFGSWLNAYRDTNYFRAIVETNRAGHSCALRVHRDFASFPGPHALITLKPDRSDSTRITVLADQMEWRGSSLGTRNYQAEAEWLERFTNFLAGNTNLLSRSVPRLRL